MPLYIAKSGYLKGVTHAWLTDSLTTLKDRTTQLLIKHKSGALVTQIVRYVMLTWDWTLHLLHLDRPLNRPLLLKWISEPEKVDHFCFVFNTMRVFWKQDDELYLVVALNLLVWNPLKVPRPFANAIRSYRHLHLGTMIVKASYNHHLKALNY